jgi:hypothetical protein
VVEDDNLEPIDLSQFHNIRQISWVGLQSEFYIRSLCDALATNSKLVTHLRLEFLPQDKDDLAELDNDIDDDDDYPNFFARNILGLKRSNIVSDVIFPALTSVKLGFISLTNVGKVLVPALNIRFLSSLTLHRCPGMEDLLREITACGETLQLSSLEYVSAYEDDAYYVCGALGSIFGLVPHLSNLFLRFSGPEATLELWRTLARNRISLTRFVYHQRTINLDENSSRYEDEEDLNDLSLLREDWEALATAGQQHPFALMNLEYLGLGCHPTIVVCKLKSRSSLLLRK